MDMQKPRDGGAEFDDNAVRRAVSGQPTKEQALLIAQERARRERERTRS
jgi:hypothetical protein